MSQKNHLSPAQPIACSAAQECDICTGLTKSLKVLPCSHSLCEACLEKIQTSNGGIKCPSCRRNYQFKSLDSIGKMECDGCSKPENDKKLWWCKSCVKLI